VCFDWIPSESFPFREVRRNASLGNRWRRKPRKSGCRMSIVRLRITFFPMTIDNVFYTTRESKVCCSFRKTFPESLSANFPRNTVCVSGDMLAVQGCQPFGHSNEDNDALTSVCIPSCVEVIYQQGLANCQAVSTMAFERDSKLSRLDERAFLSCHALTAIYIPSSGEVLCDECFRSCANLSMVTFGSCSRLMQIAGGAFAGCRSLSIICIPPSVAVVGDACFSGCRKLSIVSF
jgi:hypothetical protein